MFEAVHKPGAIQPRAFAVDDVVPASEPIWSESLAEHAAKRFKRKIVAIPGPDRIVINSAHHEIAARNSSPKRQLREEKALSFGPKNSFKLSLDGAISRAHPLIDAVGTAFSWHYPLTLSPDSIWLVIEQGFSHHVLENAEVLRSRLVRHEGKKELLATIGNISLQSFESAIDQFSSQIRDQTNQVLHETLICNFSTTTPEIRTASEVVLMDCFSAYFTYLMASVCGKPKITLTGTVDDWRSIRERVEVFAAYDLEWWLPRLRLILDEFVRTAEGDPSIEFWQAIYKPKKVYGGTTVTGWIGDLFPYLNDAPQRKKNHVFKYERSGWGIPVAQGLASFLQQGGVPHDSFPSGLSSAPVKVKFPDLSELDLELFGGFAAVQQDPKDLALSPMIGWAIVQPLPAPPPGVK